MVLNKQMELKKKPFFTEQSVGSLGCNSSKTATRKGESRFEQEGPDGQGGQKVFGVSIKIKLPFLALTGRKLLA